MSGYFSDLISGAQSLLSGLGVTLKIFLTRPVTVPYPRKEIPLSPRARGRIALVREDGKFRCIACGLCARGCPSRCIEIISEKIDGRRGNTLTGFRYDFSRCSLCGLCVETCPADAIRFIPERGRTGLKREDFMLDLVHLGDHP